MAKSYQQLWEEQKKKGVYQTTSGGKVYANETAKMADQAVQAAVQSANQQKQSGTYKTTSGGTVKTSSGSKSSSTPKVAGPVYTPPVIPKVNFQIPTPKAIVTPAAVKSAVAATVPNTAAVDAYKKKLAATQRRTTNQGMYDDETTKPAKPDVEIVLSADEAYESPRTISGYTFSQAQTPNSGYKTYAQQKTEEKLAELGKYNNYNQYMLPEGYSLFNKNVDGSEIAAYNYNPNMTRDGELLSAADFNARVEAQKQQIADEQAEQAAYNQWLAQQQTVVEEPELEEEFEEEEVNPLEEYLQAMLDAQNAQYQALIDAIRGQSGALNAQYDANAANLYELYRRGQLAFPELMSGTATGMADSFSLQNNLNFQNNLNDNELARASALQALQTEANQYQADAELQAAQTAADWAKMMYQQRLAERNSNKGSSSTGGSSGGGNTQTVQTVTAQDYIDSNYNRLDFANMTKANIKADLDYLLSIGAMSQSEYNKALRHYNII